MNPGTKPDGYGDWRDMTIAESLSWLRVWITRWLIRLKLIEYREDGHDPQTSER